jgi:hypothetical protein
MSAVLKKSQHDTVGRIFKIYEEKAAQAPRPHLGASELGHSCERHLWLSFRWAKKPEFSGKILRLFESGNREEPRLIENLRAIGVEVWDRDENGKQFNYKFAGGHGGGSMDGVALGLPEAPKTPHILEFKTSNQKGFDSMTKDGVKKSKPLHWTQMNIYMGLAGLERAMYLMVNKNTDEIHGERLEFDLDKFNADMQKAGRVVTATEPLAKVSEDPAWYECGWCRHKGMCHGTDAPDVNCRTCIHSTAELDGDGRWSCAWHKRDLSVAEQRTGCEHHRHMPRMLERFAQVVDADMDGNISYKNTITGNEFSQPALTSQEITTCNCKEMLGDPFVSAIKEEFGATITPAESLFADLKDDLPWAEKAPVKKAWSRKKKEAA